jgi:hypothetical protein
MTNRTRTWCKRWIRGHDLKLDLGVAIEDERLNFAATMVIGRWFERFGAILLSVNPRLMVDERMLAANFRRSKVIVSRDQRVFRKKHKKPHHFTLGAVFNPLAWTAAADGGSDVLWRGRAVHGSGCHGARVLLRVVH